MTTVSDSKWHRSEAADAFVERAEAFGLTDAEMLAITRLADDTDEAEAIANFIVALRQG